MGNPISKVRDEVKHADGLKRTQMEERLNILEKMVDARLDNARTEIISGTRNDQELHDGTIVSWHKRVNITQEGKESQLISEGIQDFFSGELMGGLQKLVELSADSVLGNASMGEHETKNMFIVWRSDALLRCDAYYYRWNFADKGVIDVAEGVVGILLVKRVIDVSKIDPQVVTWAVAEQADRQELSPEQTREMIHSAMQVLEQVVEYQLKVKKLSTTVSAGTGNEAD